MDDYIKDLLIEYETRFNQPFPVYEYNVERDLLEECLNRGKPVEELYPQKYDDVLY